MTNSRLFSISSQRPDVCVPGDTAMAQNKISYYEKAFRLHHENAALRKKIESLEQGQGIPALVASHEKELRKKIVDSFEKGISWASSLSSRGYSSSSIKL